MEQKAIDAMRDIARHNLEKAREDLKNQVITQEDMNREVSNLICALVDSIKDPLILREFTKLFTVEEIISALQLEEQHENNEVQ
jgi:hypothetical protein